MTITNLNRGGITQKSESVEQVTANVSNFHHYIFDMSVKRRWPLVYGNFYFPHLLPAIYPDKIPPFKNVMKSQAKMTRRTPEVRFDKILAISTFEYLDI